MRKETKDELNLTNDEANALLICEEEGSLQKGNNTRGIHGNTLNSLLRKNYITSRLYANGEFLEITNEGISALNNLIFGQKMIWRSYTYDN